MVAGFARDAGGPQAAYRVEPVASRWASLPSTLATQRPASPAMEYITWPAFGEKPRTKEFWGNGPVRVRSLPSLLAL